MESWKQIDGTFGHYAVSDMGRIMNCDTGHIRKPEKLPNGYLVFSYHSNGKRVRDYVHRLVAKAFCEHPKGCDVINHIDNNRKNNKAENLEWTTQFANVHHGMKQNRYHLQARPVVGYKGDEVFFFQSANYAGKHTGCDSSSIIKCCKGKYKNTHGYVWRYAEVMT